MRRLGERKGEGRGGRLVVKGQPNIVELNGAFEYEHYVHLVMELCAGGELFDRIIAKEHYAEAAAASLLRTIVHTCHQMGIIHRDLKPENFLLLNKDDNSPLKATDFGLSVFFKQDGTFALWDLKCSDSKQGAIRKISSEAMKGAYSSSYRRRARPVKASSKSITSVLYLKDELSIATAGATDSVVKFWDNRNLKAPVSQACSDDGLSTKKVNKPKAEPIILKGHDGEATAVDWSPSEQTREAFHESPSSVLNPPASLKRKIIRDYFLATS